MSKPMCNVIKDLLPLYVENVLSEDTINFVEEHLKKCPACQEELRKMRMPVMLPNFQKVQEQDGENIKKLRKRLKQKRILTGIISVVLTLAAVLAIWGITRPTSINDVLERAEDPFAVGEVLTQQVIDDHTTLVLYTNKDNPMELQNMVIRRTGPFYKRIDANGTLQLEKPKELESGDLRSRMLISWYQRDESHKYVAMAVVLDDGVADVAYGSQMLEEVDIDGYRVFLGFGESENVDYHLFDENGDELDHHAP